MALSKIRGRQIADGAIGNNHIAAGAGIATNKLADGAKIIFSDGSVAMLAAFNMGGYNITSLAAASGAGQAVEFNQFQNALAALNTMFSAKAPVRVASTATINIASPGATIDAIGLVAGNRVLLKDQSTPADNGIYVWNGAAVPMTRATDFDTWAEVSGMTIPVQEGSQNDNTIFLSTANPGGTIGTTAITFSAVGVTSGLQNSNFVIDEVPSGLINGSNATYTLANTPVVGTEVLYANGVRLKRGTGNDYTISGATITMLDLLLTGEILTADYRK